MLYGFQVMAYQLLTAKNDRNPEAEKSWNIKLEIRNSKQTSERDGDVKTKVIEKLTKRNLLHMLKTYAKEDNSLLITDGFKSYSHFDEYIEHMVINHSKAFSKGIVHVNTIEGFWSYVKNGIKGNYKSISPKYLPFYWSQKELKLCTFSACRFQLLKSLPFGYGRTTNQWTYRFPSDSSFGVGDQISVRGSSGGI